MIFGAHQFGVSYYDPNHDVRIDRHRADEIEITRNGDLKMWRHIIRRSWLGTAVERQLNAVYSAGNWRQVWATDSSGTALSVEHTRNI